MKRASLLRKTHQCERYFEHKWPISLFWHGMLPFKFYDLLAFDVDI